MKPKPTRREVVVAGGLALAGTVAAGLPASAAAGSVTGDTGAREHELRVLGDLLGLEQVQAYAYRRVLRSWSLDSSTHALLELALGHEAEHRAVLEQHLGALAGGASSGVSALGSSRSSKSAMSDVRTLLNDAQTPRDALRVLSKVESLSEAIYFNAVGEFQSPHLALTAAQILACEAQHWSLILNILTEGHLPEVVPDPFVRGVGQLST